MARTMLQCIVRKCNDIGSSGGSREAILLLNGTGMSCYDAYRERFVSLFTFPKLLISTQLEEVWFILCVDDWVYALLKCRNPIRRTIIGEQNLQ